MRYFSMQEELAAGGHDMVPLLRAQVDVLMPGNMGHLHKSYHSDGTLLKTVGKPDGMTRAEIQRTAKNVLRLILKTRKEELTK